MASDKEILREKFSSEADKYYRVALFDEMGFVRKKCLKCQRHFWTLSEKSVYCPEQPCQNYEFLGNPPTKEKFDYITSWRKVKRFFENNGHHSLARYPVVCRWRPDLYFTVASIVDFQRIESGRVVFEFPANPLIIPQMCLRFLDIANVGVTGRHYTSFCMIGQAAIANSEGYWKDRCIELDFNLLTKEFGIPSEEVVFKEDVWIGPGAFGNSLEYHVRGLELGNAVFTGFEGTPTKYKEYVDKVIDMGAGLERFAWLSQGTSNSYEAVFPEVLDLLRSRIGVKFSDNSTMNRYFELAGSLDADQFKGEIADFASIARQLGIGTADLKEMVRSTQALYSIADHVRTLVFAISDGALPSNVGGGYNLRVILRRSLDFMSFLRAEVKLNEVAQWHIDHLGKMYPELEDHRDDVSAILEVEEKKYAISKDRASKIIETLARKKTALDAEKLVQLYDSEGITPDALSRAGMDVDVPLDFYAKITERHMSEKQEVGVGETFDVEGLPATTLLFYLNRDQFEFRAKVLRIVDGKFVVLDSTAFYARSGGQEPDHGTINGQSVSDVTKFNNVVLHKIDNLSSGKIKEGEEVSGIVDAHRRSLIMRHHTATHIINGACRKLIGPWVWQHSAFKDEDMGRLDITHFAHLNRDQVLEIERVANEVVRRNLEVVIKWIPRIDAEKTYGFRLYQGGVVPFRELRIVNIEGWDVEACGGTHCSRTGDVGLIKIIKSERVQDGVERLEFVAGEAAVNYIEKQESILLDAASTLETPVDKIGFSVTNVLKNEEQARRSSKFLAKRLADLMVLSVPAESREIAKGVKIYISPPSEEGLDSEYHVLLGDRLSKSEPSLIYIALFVENQKMRIMAFVGTSAQKTGVRAGTLVKEIAASLGGSGGGDERFAQGGTQLIPGSLPDIDAIVLNLISKTIQ
ncbi:MAG: alanine--tRNA ligase [Nitrososphaerales archaeon]